MSVFVRDGDAFVPTAHAVGPWDPGALHGGAPAALLARELAALAPEMQVARLTYEILGPVPLAPLRASARVVKPGRRFQLAEGELTAGDGRALVRARAVLLRRAALDDVPPAAGEGPPEPGPDAARGDLSRRRNPAEGFHLTAMEIRDAGGTWSGAGAARTWFRAARDLVEGEGRADGAALAAAVADFGNGTSHAVPFDRFVFVNTDLTVHLHRAPEGEWLRLDARTRIGPDGAGVASSVLHDLRGPVGVAAQTLYVAAR